MHDDGCQDVIARLSEEWHRAQARGEEPDAEDFRERAGPCFARLLDLLEQEARLDASGRGSPEEVFPRTFGPYTLLSRLGAGGIGVVFKAVHRKLARTVALKVLGLGVGSEEAWTRFQRGARAAAQVEHEHAVRIHDCDVFEGQPYIAMTLVRGVTMLDLVRRLRETGATPFGPAHHAVLDEFHVPGTGTDTAAYVRRVAALLAGPARALAAYHAAGIVHRDVKPANLMLDREGRLILLDFDLAKTTDTVFQTKTGAMLGTPIYASPEQLKPRLGPTTPQSDVYSLGSVLYELVTLDPPRHAADLAQLLSKVGTEASPDPAARVHDLPREAARAVRKAHERSPADRYATMEAFAADLESLGRGGDVAAGPPAFHRRVHRTVARHRVVLAAVLLLALVGGALAWLRNRPGTWSIQVVPYVAEVSADGAPLERVAPGGWSPPREGHDEVEIAVRCEGFEPLDTRIPIDPGGHVTPPVIRLRPVRPKTDATFAALDEHVDLILQIGAPPKTLRSAGREALAVLYFPHGRVRDADLATCRMLLSEPVRGRLVLRPAGGREVASVPVEAGAGQVEIPFPASFREALRSGRSHEWGLLVEDEDPVYVPVQRVDDPDPAPLERIREALAAVPEAVPLYEARWFYRQRLYQAAVLRAEEAARGDEAPLAFQLAFAATEALGLGDSPMGEAFGKAYHMSVALSRAEGSLPDRLRRLGLVSSSDERLVLVGRVADPRGPPAPAAPLLGAADLPDIDLAGPATPARVTELATRGATLRAQGQLAAADGAFERALAESELVFGPESAATASAAGNLGLLRVDQGRVAEALPLFERALAIAERVLGPEHPETLTAAGNLGVGLAAAGDVEGARPLAERALQGFLRLESPAGRLVAAADENLGLVLSRLGDAGAGAPHLRRSLAIREQVDPADTRSIARALLGLGKALASAGEREAAGAMLSRALDLQERLEGPEGLEVGATLDALARLEGDQASARGRLERAVAIRRRGLGGDHPDLAASLGVLASLRARAGDAAAGGAAAEALRISRAHAERLLPLTSGASRAGIARMLRERLGEALDALAAAPEGGYAEVLRTKGLVARWEAAERRILRGADGDLASRAVMLRAAVGRLATLASTPPSPRDMVARAAWVREYAGAGAERERLAREVAATIAPQITGARPPDATSERLRAALAPDEALVDVLHAGGRYVAWIVTRDASTALLDLGPDAPIDDACAGLASAAGRPSGGIREAAARLADLVLAPLRARLPARTRTLLLVPDGALAGVPLAALPGAMADTYLLDDLLLVLLGDAADLLADAAAAPEGQGVLVLADPAHGPAGTERRPRFARLPGTLAEAKSLAALLGPEATLLLGADATEAALRTGVRGRRGVHLATHCYAREVRSLARDRGVAADVWLGSEAERQLAGPDPMLFRGIVLAGANSGEAGAGDDGILTALEASYLDLAGVDLVVLSACDGAALSSAADEAYGGMAYALRLAGARHVIASLAKVDDAATALLVQRLYEGLARKDAPLSPAAALRAAQQALRADPRFADPWLWAGFVCYGR